MNMKKIKKKILIIKILIIIILKLVVQNIKQFSILILNKLFPKIYKLIEVRQKKMKILYNRKLLIYLRIQEFLKIICFQNRKENKKRKKILIKLMELISQEILQYKKKIQKEKFNLFIIINEKLYLFYIFYLF